MTTVPGFCKHPGCKRPVKATGYCEPHYRRARDGRPMDSPIRKVDPTRGCIISGCDRGHLAKGFCDTHYSRVQNGWDLYADVRIIDPRRVCCIPFCDNPYTASGVCSGHYAKFSRYRVSLEFLVVSAFSVCRICGSASNPDGRELAIDHDHRCCPGKTSCGSCVRGLLCNQCNRALGMFGDDPAILEKAISYLQSGSIGEE